MTVLNKVRSATDFRILALALMLGAGSVVLLAGCESDGPAEEAGESIDETAEEAGDEMEEATD